MEPGETIYKAGHKGDEYYIVIKGRVHLSIPAPNNNDFGMPVIPKPEVVKKDATEEEKLEERKRIMNRVMSPDELAELPENEQKKYTTR